MRDNLSQIIHLQKFLLKTPEKHDENQIYIQKFAKPHHVSLTTSKLLAPSFLERF